MGPRADNPPGHPGRGFVQPIRPVLPNVPRHRGQRRSADQASLRGLHNGWLSDLEGSVRLAISAIILDLPVVLGHIQTQVAAWCFKTALISQKGGGAGFYADADAQAFRATRLPPATHTAIWLARHNGEVSVFFDAVTLDRAEPAGQPAVPVGYVTTAVISHLAMQVLTVRPDAGIAGVLVAPGPWDQALLPVWPVRGEIRWPPAASLDRAGIDALSARFSPRAR